MKASSASAILNKLLKNDPVGVSTLFLAKVTNAEAQPLSTLGVVNKILPESQFVVMQVNSHENLVEHFVGVDDSGDLFRKLNYIVRGIHKMREYHECTYGDGDDPRDCGNYRDCRPECPLAQLRKILEIQPRDDADIAKCHDVVSR